MANYAQHISHGNESDYCIGDYTTFRKRLSIPNPFHEFYTTRTFGGKSDCDLGSFGETKRKYPKKSAWLGSVLPNCVGWAWGRVSEVNGQSTFFNRVRGDGGKILAAAKNAGWQVDESCLNPRVGALVVWERPGAEGHVAFIEDLSYDLSIDDEAKVKYNYVLTLSDSGYGYPEKPTNEKEPYTTKNIVRTWKYKQEGYSNRWKQVKDSGFNWSDLDKYYVLKGFVYPPYVGGNYISGSNSSFVGNPPDDISKRSSDATSTWSDPTRGWSSGGNRSGGAFSEREAYEVVAKTREVERKGVLHTNDLDVVDSQGTQLLSYPSLVESPFVIAKIGGYTFGTYGTKRILTEDGTHSVSVQYPDYIQSLQVEKVNGSVNTYTLNLVYQIAAGADPNLVDKILSTAGYGSTVVLTYGDFASPAFIYKEEQAILTKVVSSINFNSSQISYTITAVSNSFNLWGTAFQFTSQNFKRGKPSDIIKSLFRNKSYKLQEIFYGMKESDLDSLIAGDDLVVDLEAQQSMDVLTYINYLVTCMCSVTNDPSSVIRDSTYALVIHDDVYESENYTGPYFTVDKIPTSTKTMSAMNVYTVDVGYPSNTMVMDFQIHNDDSWALLYKYGVQDDFDTNNFIYKLDNNGNMVSQFSPGLTTSTKRYITTENQKTWWTSMTQHPITATLVVKGLIRPALLMSYVKINSFFYGQRHVSSGLYIITKQVDTIRGEGYRTTLSLTRISGDDAYIGTYKAVETYFERGKRIAREEASADTTQNKKLTVEQTKDAMDKIGVTNRSEDFYKAVADEANGVNAADRPT